MKTFKISTLFTDEEKNAVIDRLRVVFRDYSLKLRKYDEYVSMNEDEELATIVYNIDRSYFLIHTLTDSNLLTEDEYENLKLLDVL